MLPRGEQIKVSDKIFQLPNRQCMQRAVVLPSLCCSLPRCNKTQHGAVLLVLTNQHLRKWVGYLRFELDHLKVRSGARIIDAELQLHGSVKCRDQPNFTHQLHLLRAQQASLPPVRDLASTP